MGPRPLSLACSALKSSEKLLKALWFRLNTTTNEPLSLKALGRSSKTSKAPSLSAQQHLRLGRA